MSYTPFNAPLLSGLLGDPQTVACFSVKAELAAALRFEEQLAFACAGHGFLPEAHAEAIAGTIAGFEPDMAALGEGTARDGVFVPELVRQLRAILPDEVRASLHFGATSQDVIDTSLALRLKQVIAILAGRLSGVRDRIGELDMRFGSRTLMAQTRMQPALPVRVADRLHNWSIPLADQAAELASCEASVCRLQLGGPAGNRHAWDAHGEAVAATLAHFLDLADAPQWHTSRSSLVAFCGLLARIAGSLGKIGQDIALMAQHGRNEITLSIGGGSSAMPHKHNPVAAETLVALARFAATLEGGMQQAMLHEQERSGAAWTLEWMILPQLCVACGASTRTALALLDAVESLGGEEA